MEGEFQYILCFGLTELERAINKHWAKFQYILCFGLTVTSIVSNIHISEFQYILCFGLTEKDFYERLEHLNFNTSYVSV